MNKIFIFLIIASCIVILSIVGLMVGPITNKFIGQKWGYQNCGLINDKLNIGNFKEDFTTLKSMYKVCNRQKAIHNMEYTSYIINIILGYICTDLALIHYLGYGKDFQKKTGIIGLCCGGIGFILTFVYFCYNCYILKNDIAFLEINIDEDGVNYNEDNTRNKLYTNGALYKWVEYDDHTGEYLNIDEFNFVRKDFSNYIRYKDLGKDEYNFRINYYRNYLNLENKDEDEYLCSIDKFKINGIITIQYEGRENYRCKYIYAKPEKETINRTIYNRWVSSLVLSLTIIIGNLAMALIGAFLFSNIECTNILNNN